MLRLLCHHRCKPCTMSCRRVMSVTLECLHAGRGNVSIFHMQPFLCVADQIYLAVHAMQSNYSPLIYTPLSKTSFQIMQSTITSRLSSRCRTTTTSHIAKKSVRCFRLSKSVLSFCGVFIRAYWYGRFSIGSFYAALRRRIHPMVSTR